MEKLTSRILTFKKKKNILLNQDHMIFFFTVIFQRKNLFKLLLQGLKGQTLYFFKIYFQSFEVIQAKLNS